MVWHGLYVGPKNLVSTWNLWALIWKKLHLKYYRLMVNYANKLRLTLPPMLLLETSSFSLSKQGVQMLDIEFIITLKCPCSKEFFWKLYFCFESNFKCFLVLNWRQIQSGVDDITTDDSWALYLNKLIEALWPGGKLREEFETPKSELEKSRTRKEAAYALMNAFPGLWYCLIISNRFKSISSMRNILSLLDKM